MDARKQLATFILTAIQTREDSYDHKAANAASVEANEYNSQLSPTDHRWKWVDYSEFYTKTLWQVCEEAPGGLAQPVYLLLYYSPNDAQDWAREVLGIALPTTGDGPEIEAEAKDSP